jgi:hypothetical protein
LSVARHDDSTNFPRLLANTPGSLIAWWIPHATLLASLFASVPIRSTIWIVTLIWMGSACIANSRRCGRIHCRYTGPYYLAMIGLVLVISLIASGIYEWIALGVVIVTGDKLIWWATERAWGKFSWPIAMSVSDTSQTSGDV